MDFGNGIRMHRVRQRGVEVSGAAELFLVEWQFYIRINYFEIFVVKWEIMAIMVASR